VQAPLGTDTFTIYDYSGTNGSGTVLAQATFTQSVTAGMSPITVTLNGVLSQVALSLQTPALTAGTAGTATLNVNGYDAAGNLITGTFGAPITIASDSTSVSLSGTSVTASGQSITVTYGGGTAPYTVHFSASSNGVAANLLVGTTLAIVPTQAFLIAGFPPSASPYVRSYPVNALNDPGSPITSISTFGANTTYTLQTTSAGGYGLSTTKPFTAPSGNILNGCALRLYNSAGTVIGNPLNYASPNSTVYFFNGNNGYFGTGCPFVFDTAAARAGDVVIYDTAASNQIDEYAVTSSGFGTSVRTIALSGSVPSALIAPGALAIDGSGTLYVAAPGQNTGSAIPSIIGTFPASASGSVAPSATITTANSVVDMVVNSTGTLYVLETAQTAAGWQVEAFANGVRTGVFSYAAPNAFSQAPTGIAIDAAGEIMVGAILGSTSSAYTEFVVFVFPPGSSTNATPTRTFGGAFTLVEQGPVAGPRILSTAPSAPAATTVTGDMLGYAPNRTWTYSTTQNGTTSYFGIYADPQSTSGVVTLVLFCTTSSSCTSSNPFVTGQNVAALSFQQLPNGYLINSFASASNNSSGVVPGAPLLVPSSLQAGQSWNPFSNSSLLGLVGSVSASVARVGAINASSACPGGAASGAVVTYTTPGPLTGSSLNVNEFQTLSFVPGCGIVQFTNSAGQVFTLTSVGTQNLGTLEMTRTTQSATIMGTLRAVWQQLLVKHPN